MPSPSTFGHELHPGDVRLLHDLAVLRAALDGRRLSARKRLERRLGPDFTRTVLASLAETAARAA
jgi:hypothetical protein